MIAGLIRTGAAKPDQLLACDPRLDRLQELKEHYGVVIYTENNEAVRQAEIILLAVKPQALERALKPLRGVVRPQALVLSIVAGATIQKISQSLDHPNVVRAMPNTPAQIGEGITVWTNSPSVNPEQLEMARTILSALGDEIYVDEENYLDMATALSGTGPAYVFLFLEGMIDAGVHLGLSRHVVEQLVVKTMLGSVHYYERSKVHPAALRNQVTSPGGTSAAALYYLEKAGFRTALSRAIWAAFERSQELGKGGASHTPEPQNKPE